MTESKTLGKLFQDNSGNTSSMRVAFVVVVGIATLAFGLTSFGLVSATPDVHDTIRWVFGAAFGGKAIQKLGK